MKAVRFHDYGDADVLVLDEVDDPAPGEGEVVVRVEAVALNHVDIDIRNGTSRLPLQLPHTLGIEFAGEVAAAGDGVDGFRPGDKVTPLYQLTCGRCAFCRAGEQQQCRQIELFGVQRPGGYAEYAIAPAAALIPLPADVDPVVAAAVQTTFGTVWHSLIVRANLRPGETVLISAVGSGVGSAALELARMSGACTIVTAGSDWKIERAKALGADHGINYATTPVSDAVAEITGGAGADVVVEHVGGDVFTESLKSLRPQGRLVVCGGHGGEVSPLDLIELFRAEWSIIGCARANESELRHVVKLATEKAFDPVVDTVLPLAAAPDAHRKMENREQFGKIVLSPGR